MIKYFNANIMVIEKVNKNIYVLDPKLPIFIIELLIFFIKRQYLLVNGTIWLIFGSKSMQKYGFTPPSCVKAPPAPESGRPKVSHKFT
jgi:hypothetical protein